MQKNLVALFSRVHFPLNGRRPAGQKRITALNLEIANLGYSFDPTALAALRQTSSDQFDAFRSDIIGTLKDLTGASARQAALYNNFPYETPDQLEYLLARTIGWVQNHYDMRPNEAQVLSCGHVIDLRLFNLADFAHCPICQQETDETSPTDTARYEFKRLTPLKLLSYADETFIRMAASGLLARMSSLSVDERDFLRSARGLGGLARPSAVFRENLPFVYAFFGDIDYVKTLMSGATDVMRIATYLSDDTADLSLKETVKFRLSTKHKKDMLRLIETLRNPTEDMMRRRERWLRLGEKLNPGTVENRRRFPKTAAAFDILRDDPKSIPTFNRLVERKIRSSTIDVQLLQTLVIRPGEFLRRLDLLLRTSSNAEPILVQLAEAARGAPLKLLFEVNKYLSNRLKVGYLIENPKRVFIPKGQTNKLQIVDDTRARIPAATLVRAGDILTGEIQSRLSQLPALGSVYLDPALRHIVMPFNRRGDISTTANIAKGSRYPLAVKDVIRLFIWWKAATDIDLSILLYDAQFRLLNNISWHNLAGFSAVHSGDVRSAPNGGSEFIDFGIDDLRSHGVRYVISSVISFSGEPFDGFPCFAGFMERDSLRSGHKYEPESVTLKFDIKAKTKSTLPLIFDLDQKSVIFADLTAGGGRHATMAGGETKFVTLTRAVLDLPNSKPTAYDVLAAHVGARGKLVEDPNLADATYTLDNLDLNAIAAMMS